MKDRSSSWASSPEVRRTMQGNRGRDTGPELAVRRLLHSHGYRYRVNYRPVLNVRRTADIVFTRARVAVFIDGCFWHGCNVHYQSPARNSAFWARKIEANRARDLETAGILTANGWIVLRYWEHEPPGAVATAIEHALARRRELRTVQPTRARNPL